MLKSNEVFSFYRLNNEIIICLPNRMVTHHQASVIQLRKDTRFQRKNMLVWLEFRANRVIHSFSFGHFNMITHQPGNFVFFTEHHES